MLLEEAGITVVPAAAWEVADLVMKDSEVTLIIHPEEEEEEEEEEAVQEVSVVMTTTAQATEMAVMAIAAISLTMKDLVDTMMMIHLPSPVNVVAAKSRLVPLFLLALAEPPTLNRHPPSPRLPRR